MKTLVDIAQNWYMYINSFVETYSESSIHSCTCLELFSFSLTFIILTFKKKATTKKEWKLLFGGIERKPHYEKIYKSWFLIR